MTPVNSTTTMSGNHRYTSSEVKGRSLLVSTVGGGEVAGGSFRVGEGSGRMDTPRPGSENMHEVINSILQTSKLERFNIFQSKDIPTSN